MSRKETRNRVHVPPDVHGRSGANGAGPGTAKSDAHGNAARSATSGVAQGWAGSAAAERLIVDTTERVVRELLPSLTLTFADAAEARFRQWSERVAFHATVHVSLMERLAGLRGRLEAECRERPRTSDRHHTDEHLLKIFVRTISELRNEQRRLAGGASEQGQDPTSETDFALMALKNCEEGLMSDLSLLGCEANVPEIGARFDPRRHRRVPAPQWHTPDKARHDHVAAVLVPGFTYAGRMLEPAEVAVWEYQTAA